MNKDFEPAAHRLADGRDFLAAQFPGEVQAGQTLLLPEKRVLPVADIHLGGQVQRGLSIG